MPRSTKLVLCEAFQGTKILSVSWGRVTGFKRFLNIVHSSTACIHIGSKCGMKLAQKTTLFFSVIYLSAALVYSFYTVTLFSFQLHGLFSSSIIVETAEAMMRKQKSLCVFFSLALLLQWIYYQTLIYLLFNCEVFFLYSLQFSLNWYPSIFPAVYGVF